MYQTHVPGLYPSPRDAASAGHLLCPFGSCVIGQKYQNLLFCQSWNNPLILSCHQPPGWELRTQIKTRSHSLSTWSVKAQAGGFLGHPEPSFPGETGDRKSQETRRLCGDTSCPHLDDWILWGWAPCPRNQCKRKGRPLPTSCKLTAEFRHRQHCQPKPFSRLTSNTMRFDPPVNTGAAAIGIWFEK